MMNSADISCSVDTSATDGSASEGGKLLSPRSKIEPVLDQRFQEMSFMKNNEGTRKKDPHQQKLQRTASMKKRSVSFELDDDGSIKDHINTNACVITLTDDEKRNLWWSSIETAVMAERLRLITLYYHKNKGEYKANFLHLFLRCSRSPKISPKEGTEIMAVDQRGRRSARGLERHINEILSIYRNNYVKTILDIQSKMPSELSPEIKARLLRATSSNLTKPSRNLARFLAHQDEIEAGENTLKDFHDSGIRTV